jgi:hypothetical protein
MRAGRAALATLAAVVLLAGLGAWLLPGVLDWNRFRPEIERLASAALNRPVQIGGAITLDLLPEPALKAEDLRVADAGDGVTLTAREMRLHVALGPLLAGRLHPRSMVLLGPALGVPWPLPPGALQSRPAWLRSARAQIVDGALRVGGLALTGVDAQFATDPNTGTLTAAGSAALGGHVWRFTARLTQPGRDGAAGLDATLDGQDALQDTGGRFSGTVGADGALAGQVTGRGRDLAQLVPAPAETWQASGSLSASGGLLVADDLALELGGSPARGVVALRVGDGARLDLALATSRLDLDGWLRVLVSAPATPLPTGIDLSAEAATLAGGTLRRLRGGFDLTGSGSARAMTVRDVSALLPGDAALTLAGTVSGQGDGLRFKGDGRLDAPDLRVTSVWASAAAAPGIADALPAGALRTASFSGAVAVQPGQVVLSDLRGTLDGAGVQGGVSLTLGAQPALAANLTLDALQLDAWLPRPDAVATAYPWPGVAARFAHLDADLALHARSAAWAGLALDAVDVAARFDRHGVQVRRLALSGAGVQMSLSGSVGEGGQVTDGKLDVTAKDAAALRAVRPDWEGWRLLRGPGEIHAEAAGPPDAIKLRLSASLGDLRAEAQPVVNARSGGWTGPVSLRHPGAPRLLGQLGWLGAAAWIGEGSFSLDAQAAFGSDGGSLHDVTLTAGALRAGGALDFQRGTGPTRVTGAVTAGALPLPHLSPSSLDPLPLGALRGLDVAVELQARQALWDLDPVMTDLGATITVRDGALRLAAVRTKLAGGAVEGRAVLDAGQDPPRLAVQGRATAVAISGPLTGASLDVAGGAVDASVDLTARGYSPAALLSTLSGDAHAALRDGAVTGFDLGAAGLALGDPDAVRRERAVRDALQGGATAFSTLDLAAGLRDGVATLVTAHLAGPDGIADAAGTLDLPGGLLDLRLALRAAEPAGAPALAVSLDGPAAAPERTADLAALLRWSPPQPATQ